MSQSLITIATIPAGLQRYETAGDWTDAATHLGFSSQINVSRNDNWRVEACIAIHELAEMFICRHMKVTTEMVDEWDEQHTELEEPGDHPKSPYFIAHQVATDIEVHLCQALGMNWKEYDAIIQGKEISRFSSELPKD